MSDPAEVSSAKERPKGLASHRASVGVYFTKSPENKSYFNHKKPAILKSYTAKHLLLVIASLFYLFNLPLSMNSKHLNQDVKLLS